MTRADELLIEATTKMLQKDAEISRLRDIVRKGIPMRNLDEVFEMVRGVLQEEER